MQARHSHARMNGKAHATTGKAYAMKQAGLMGFPLSLQLGGRSDHSTMQLQRSTPGKDDRGGSSTTAGPSLIELIDSGGGTKLRITRSIKEIGPCHISAAGRHIRQLIALDTAFESELELDATGIIDK
jgi:hypothetical protein